MPLDSWLELYTPDGLILHELSSKDPRQRQLEISDHHLVNCDTVHLAFTISPVRTLCFKVLLQESSHDLPYSYWVLIL